MNRPERLGQLCFRHFLPRHDDVLEEGEVGLAAGVPAHPLVRLPDDREQLHGGANDLPLFVKWSVGLFQLPLSTRGLRVDPLPLTRWPSATG